MSNQAPSARRLDSAGPGRKTAPSPGRSFLKQSVRKERAERHEERERHHRNLDSHGFPFPAETAAPRHFVTRVTLGGAASQRSSRGSGRYAGPPRGPGMWGSEGAFGILGRRRSTSCCGGLVLRSNPMPLPNGRTRVRLSPSTLRSATQRRIQVAISILAVRKGLLRTRSRLPTLPNVRSRPREGSQLLFLKNVFAQEQPAARFRRNPSPGGSWLLDFEGRHRP